MAMQPICNLTVAVLLALGASAATFAQEEGQRPGRAGEGRSFEGRAGAGERGEGGGRRNNATAESAGPARGNTPAVPLPPVTGHAWLDEIAELEAQAALLEKRDELSTRRIDSQIRLKQKRSELDALERESTDEMLAHLPQVVAVLGVKNNYQCQLFFPTGRVSYARVGDQIGPGVRVKSIAPSGVEVDVVMGEASQRRQVPLNFVSLSERRGENEGGSGDGSAIAPGEFFRTIFGPRTATGAGAGAAPRPPAGAPAAARPSARGAAPAGGN